jgi:hypothetical protein
MALADTDAITKVLIGQIRDKLDDAANIAKAAEVCAEAGNVAAAVRMLMDVEDPVHIADRMMQATLLIRRELSDSETY